jgi:hypothetical protein
MTNYHATSEGNIPFTEEEEIEWARQGATYENEQPKILIKAEIAAIEATITPRRQREAILNVDNGWLAQQDAAITALRAQL